MKKIYDKNPVLSGIIMGNGVILLFFLVEGFLDAPGMSDNRAIFDTCIRVVFGVIALVFMKVIYQEQFSSFFTEKIPKSTWLYCIPYLLYILIVFFYVPIFDRLTNANRSYFLLKILQLLATGFFEEAVSKGLVMSGMLSKWEDTTKGRFGMVFINGILFGSIHILNVFSNHDIIQCLWTVLYAVAFGVFTSAIYLYSKNITLCMALHAAWDIVIVILTYFGGGVQEEAVLTFLYVFQYVILPGSFPIIAIMICVLKGKKYKPISLNYDLS